MPWRKKKKDVQVVITDGEIPLSDSQSQQNPRAQSQQDAQSQPPSYDPCAFYKYVANELIDILNMPEAERQARLTKLLKYALGIQ